MSPLTSSPSARLLINTMRRKRAANDKPRGSEKHANRRWLRRFSKQFCTIQLPHPANDAIEIESF